MNETELHIIKRVLSGDIGAFEELVKRYEKPIVNYIYRFIPNYEECLDLTQDVFVKAFFNLDKYDKTFRFSTWLYRIARNTAIDTLRKKKPITKSIDQPISRDESVCLQVPSIEQSPEDRLRNDEFIKTFNKAVQSLPLEYREVITLRHINFCSYTEIAEICQLPIGTVKNRIFRGREMLRKKLEGKI